MPPGARIFLGAIEFLLSAEGAPLRLRTDEAYRSFVVPADGALPKPARTVHVVHAIAEAPAFEGEVIFESEATWSILARAGERAFVFRHPDGETLFVAAFAPGSDRVEIQCARRLLVAEGSGLALPSPFQYPLDQVLTMYLLGDRGVVVHAAGALVGGRGLVFAGVSGAGKSTLTRIGSGRPGWESLSDDRMILRRAEGRPALHGTPWPGEGRAAENRQGPLAGLFFLEQGRVNGTRRLETKEALARLLRTASVPWYDAEYLGPVLDACGAVVSGTPSAVLEFLPDSGAIEAALRFCDEVAAGSGRPDPA